MIAVLVATGDEAAPLLEALGRDFAENGFDGFFMDDHVPHVVGDTDYGHRAKAFANGYIQSLIEAVTDKSLHGAR